jgi:hypothetical protein
MYPASPRIFPDHILAIAQVRRRAPLCAKRPLISSEGAKNAEDNRISMGWARIRTSVPGMPPSGTQIHQIPTTLAWRRSLYFRIGGERVPSGQPASVKACESSRPVRLAFVHFQPLCVRASAWLFSAAARVHGVCCGEARCRCRVSAYRAGDARGAKSA